MSRWRMILALTAALCMWLGASGLWAQTGAEGAAQSYVVQKGDTAKSIAKRFYGKSSLGGKLWAANRQLVDHPKRLTPGDTLFIFPEAALKAGQVAAVPPPLPGRPVELYDRGRPLNISFPKYFTFLADGRGLGESGSIRMKVKKDVPVPDSEDGSYVTEESLFEVRQVGAIIASNEHPGLVYGDGADKAAYWGKVNLSTNDEVMVYFTEDVAKILDGDTYGDSDPYFREFPIYGKSYTSRQPIDNRPDKGKSMGELYRFKGKVTIVARVEGTAPMTPRNSKALKKKGRAAGQDTEPVTYVGRITYAVDAVELDDEVFLFIPLNPGPERVLDPPFVEPPDSYTSLGN